MAARGHIASFIYEISSILLSWGGGIVGGLFGLPQLDTVSLMHYYLCFQFACVNCDMFCTY